MIYNDIKYFDNGKGYFKSCNGEYLHRAIYEQHKGKIPEGYIVHHKDGNKMNNSIKNLEVMSESEHRSLHHPKTNEKLTHFEHVRILNLYHKGLSQKDISVFTHRSMPTIYDVVKGRRYKQWYNWYYKQKEDYNEKTAC